MENSERYSAFEQHYGTGEADPVKEWASVVPKEIRRLEYEAWKLSRELIHIEEYRYEISKGKIRTINIPPYTEEMSEKEWQDFSATFLKREEKNERREVILDSVIGRLSNFYEQLSENCPPEKIKFIGLSGSAAYGPRASGEKLSDIDVHFLIDDISDKYNFEVLPNVNDKSDEQFHLFGTGKSDEARGKHRMFHWMLLPRITIKNEYSAEELEEIQNQLFISTNERLPEIKKGIHELQQHIVQLKNDIGYTK